MPSTGTSSSYRPGSILGAPSAYTEAGPPLRLSAAARRPHGPAEAAAERRQDRRERPLAGHATPAALRNQLLGRDVALEVAVFRVAALHRTERGHAAVLLEAVALVDDHVSRSPVGSCQHR